MKWTKIRGLRPESYWFMKEPITLKTYEWQEPNEYPPPEMDDTRYALETSLAEWIEQLGRMK